MPKSSYKLSPDSLGKKDTENSIQLASFSSNGDLRQNEGSEEVQVAEPKMVSAKEVFRFASMTDKLLMVLGLIGACVHGATRPTLMVFFGNMADMFIDDSRLSAILDEIMPNLTQIFPNITKEWIYENPENFTKLLLGINATDLVEIIEGSVIGDLLDRMSDFALYYCVAGCIVIVAAFFQMSCWQVTAYKQSQRIRNALIRAILRQDIGWFDTHEVGELNSRLADDVDQIEAGIGDKLSIVLQHFSTFIAGFVIAFVHGWQLALVILALVPFIALIGVIANKIGTIWTKRELQAYAQAGAVAEEVLGAIRTVVAFGGQERESKRYAENLTLARDMGYKKGIGNSVGISFAFLTLYTSYAVAFWYGTDLVSKGTLSGGNVLTVFFAIMMGGFSIGNAMPNLQDFANSRGAAHAVYKVIDSVPPIDSASPEGEKPEDIQGNIEFKDVHFEYPARKNTPVLQGLSLQAHKGETVALVGASGCGKSTTIQLLQRFYDPHEGQVLIDGRDIRTLNVKWLRQHIGVVSQEPVLFGATIAENIRYGREDVTEEEMLEAAKMANAHSFICTLPKKYETMIGERGTQLSGGQKQRIAIARALVSDPKILLLDEATSALDTESEASVQQALDKASMGRTTIVVAHRLSTIKNADIIVGFKDGVAVEQGSHHELMKDKNGVYHQLVTNQTRHFEAEKQDMKDDVANMKTDNARDRADSLKFKRALSLTSNLSSEVDEKGDETVEPDLKRILRLNAPEWAYIMAGCFGAMIAGGVQPASAVLMTQILSIFDGLDPDQMKKDGLNLAMIYLGIGFIAAFASCVMNISFSRSGEQLTLRLRKLAFEAMLRQDMSFFDDLSNSTGALCTRLASDAALVKGATGIRLSVVVQSLASLGTGLGIGFYYSWKLTLLVLGFVPFIMIAGTIGISRLRNASKHGKRNPLEESGKVAVEAIENIRTVASLTKEDHFSALYDELIQKPYAKKRRSAYLQGLGYGSSFSILFFCYAACYTLGAYLIEEGELEYYDMFRVIACMIFGAQGAGQAASFGLDFSKANSAAARMFALFDHQPLIDSNSNEGKTLDTVTGRLSTEGVYFNYPTRPKLPVLRGLSFAVHPGQTVALVGSSGCGKSTVVQLIERFYDPLQGWLNMDGERTQELNIQWMRSQMSVVSQEPTLFDCSIRENIAYGDNSREVPMNEIIAAACSANIHNFITSLPEGYDTNVGDKGTQLSGGQKQRVAIARALIRNPKVLLLDEATSALDTESEKVVQEALDKAREGRTSIVIAHRLSTIQDADCIVVIDKGRVAESGTHAQLLGQRGIYYNLNNAQLGNKHK